MVCVVEGVPLYLYKEQGQCYSYSWHEVLGCIALACPHATACRRGGQEASAKVCLPLGVDCLLTKLSHHRLRMVGCGLDLDHSLVGSLPN